ncbi:MULTISPECIES: hypothetical protein [unclassified Microcoleus]|nr:MULTISPECIES: hypothetical protein [unclassified Microcoleus]
MRSPNRRESPVKSIARRIVPIIIIVSIALKQQAQPQQWENSGNG